MVSTSTQNRRAIVVNGHRDDQESSILVAAIDVGEARV
jgi:hypothetical protein